MAYARTSALASGLSTVSEVAFYELSADSILPNLLPFSAIGASLSTCAGVVEI